MAFPTATAVLNQVQAELALPLTDINATDALTIQLMALFNKAGQELVEEDWSHLTNRYTFSPTASGPYALPADYRSLIPQSGWDTTSMLPLQGPVSDRDWEQLLARNVVNAVGTPFRTWQNQLFLYPGTGYPTGRTIAFEYRSSFWVAGIAAPGALPIADVVAYPEDIIWFERKLIVSALKLAWKREKGFDSTAAQQDFEANLQRAKDNDVDAPVLTLNGRRDSVLLNLNNLPEGNYTL